MFFCQVFIDQSGFKLEQWVASQFYDFETHPDEYESLKRKVDYYYLIFDATGIFLAYTRLLEPFVFQHFMNFLWILWIRFTSFVACRKVQKE